MQPPGPGPVGPPGGYGTGLPPGTEQPAHSAGGGAQNDPLGLAAVGAAVAALPLNCCCGPLAIALSITAAVLGVVSVTRISAQPTRFKGRGIAITGIVVGALGVLIYPLLLVFSVALPFATSAPSWPP